jgi:hypothetical protein
VHELLHGLGEAGADGVEVDREPAAVDDFPERVPRRVPQRLQVRRVRDVEPAHGAALGHALHLRDGGLDRMVRNRRETRIALGMARAELREPLVVDPHDLDGRLRIIHAAGGAEDSVEHLGLDAVPVLVLQSQIGIGQATDALLAVVVEPGLGHAVGAMNAAGDVLASGRAHAVHEPQIGALLRNPHLALGPVDDVRHPVSHVGGGAGDEEIGGKPAEIEVAVGGDHLVAHGFLQPGDSTALSSSGGRRGG